MFNQCYELSKTYIKNRGGELIQVAGYKQEINKDCDPRWLSIPPNYWTHYLVKKDNVIIDLTCKQFGLTDYLYSSSELMNKWDRIYFL